MRICVPILLPHLDQVPPEAWTEGWGVETALFDREPMLDDVQWGRCLAVARQLARHDRPQSLIFHFPPNGGSYVGDPAVSHRLLETVDFVAAEGFDGLVVHANEVLPAAVWRDADLIARREGVVEVLAPLAEQLASADIWLGLENMPIMGNEIDESDPTFVHPADFDILEGTSIRITWDICHASYSDHVQHALRQGRIPPDEHELYPNLSEHPPQAWRSLGARVAHLHFSGFTGLATGADACTEGVVPWRADLGEAFYAGQLKGLTSALPGAFTITLEIQDADYTNRQNLLETARWIAPLVR